MSDRILVTLPNGEDVRLEQDGNLVTVWRWADPAPFTNHAAWVVAGQFTTINQPDDDVETPDYIARRQLRGL